MTFWKYFKKNPTPPEPKPPDTTGKEDGDGTQDRPSMVPTTKQDDHKPPSMVAPKPPKPAPKPAMVAPKPPKPPAPKPPKPAPKPAMVTPKPPKPAPKPAMVTPKPRPIREKLTLKPVKKRPNSRQSISSQINNAGRIKKKIKPVGINTNVKQQVHEMITPKQSVPGFCVTADGYIDKMPMIKDISVSNRSDCQGKSFFSKSKYTGCLYKEKELKNDLKPICVSDEWGHAAALFNPGQNKNGFCFAIRENKGDKTCSIDMKGSLVTTNKISQDLPSELTDYLKLANK